MKIKGRSRLTLLALVVVVPLFVIALMGLLVSGCAGGVSRVDREVRDAVVMELVRSGLSLPIVDETLELRKEEEREAEALLGLCLADEVPDADLSGLFRLNARSVSWEGAPLRTMWKSMRTIISPNDDPGPDYLMFSRPWVTGSGGRALIYVERRCPLCGFGRYYLLERVPSGWVVASACEAWVS